MKPKYIIRSFNCQNYERSYYTGAEEGYGERVWDSAECAQRFNSEDDALMIAANKISAFWQPLEVKKIYEKS
jgi:hypothetical protein